MGYQVLVCFGTRPEAVKLAPVVAALGREPDLDVRTLTTGQHRELLEPVLDAFALRPDVDLGLMRPDQGLAELTSAAIASLSATIERHRPDAIIVQGDTTTAFCAALAGFYAGVPVGHVEAGLRTGDPSLPFPEEANRRMIAALARWNWAPTARNARALIDEGVPAEHISITGNTVIDALRMVAGRPLPAHVALEVPPKRAPRRVLVTLHRRETRGEVQRELCRMFAELAGRPDTEVVLPVHLCPVVRDTVMSELAGLDGVRITGPLDYRAFVQALRESDVVATDSGGLQEEAPVFGVPVVLMREKTERPEAVEAGGVRVAGTDPEAVRAAVEELLDDPVAHATMAAAPNPYGDGRAAERIVADLVRDLPGAEAQPLLVPAG